MFLCVTAWLIVVFLVVSLMLGKIAIYRSITFQRMLVGSKGLRETPVQTSREVSFISNNIDKFIVYIAAALLPLHQTHAPHRLAPRIVNRSSHIETMFYLYSVRINIIIYIAGPTCTSVNPH